MKCWTISFTDIGYRGAKLPGAKLGTFATKSDAQRYLDDNPKLKAMDAHIVKSWANAVCSWRADDPDADMGRMEHDDKGDN